MSPCCSSWTTWCPYCKSDQTAVDNIAAEFGSRGLSVVAIDVGEQETTVRNFLQKSPRSCTIGMDTSASVVSQFGGGGFPHYVVIDRQGNIVASRSGAAGEAGLRSLVGRGGDWVRPEPVPCRLPIVESHRLQEASVRGG